MANPKPPQPERKPSAAASRPPDSAANRETKRPTDSTPIATGTFAKLPMRFGRYQVEKLLGKGAMGAVYLARDTQLERLVALKIPKISATGSARLLKRLKTEAKAAAQIDHPCVCPVYDSGDIDGIPFLAMQFIEGETLKDHLQNVAKTPQQTLELILHLAEGLSEAHSKGIYHRDLKPENIKLNRRGLPVIMDFGLAKLATTLNADASATQAGTTLGTPAYMSPEQANGKVDEIDHRSDIYALGVMLFEMLTRQWPFAGSTMQVMAQKTIMEPPSPQTVKPDLDPQLAAVCHKMIAKERQNRYQNAKDVIAALKALDMGSGLQASAGSVVSGNSQASFPALLPSFEQDDALSSIIARKRQAANRGGAAGKLGGKTRRITHAVACWWHEQSRGMKWTGLAAGVLLVGLIGLQAGGVFTKVKTTEGTLVIEVNEPGAEVLVDGEKVNVTWADGKMKATVQVKAGERQVEVRKDGFSVAGKKITFKESDRVVFKAKLESVDTLAQKQAAPPPVIAPFTPVAPLPSSDLDRIATGKWIRLVDSQTVLSDPQKMRFQNGILELDSTKMDFPEINARDVFIRAQVRKVSGQNVGIRLRCGSGHFGAWFNGFNADGGDFFGIGKVGEGRYIGLGDSHIGRKFQPDAFVEMAFAAIGDTLTLYVDGTKTLTVTNNDVASGFISISAFKGKSLFKDVEYQILDPVPISKPK